MNEREVRERGRLALIGIRPMTKVGRAVEKGETDGFMKVLVDAETKEILGATILGTGGDEAIHCILTAKVSLAYTVDSRWRNRAEFANGRQEIVALLTRKWIRELDYRLVKELWAFLDNRIAVRFAYEYHDDSGNWFRAYGNENWEFDPEGLMHTRHASINELRITEDQRKFHWPLGRRPDEHPGLTDLAL